MSVSIQIQEYLHQLNHEGLLRNRRLVSTDRSSLVHFDCNDYLSLAEDKRISEAYQQGYAQYPSGSGASMMLSGYHANHRALEQAFADLLSVDECVLFSSGYAANLAVTSLLGKLKIHCLIDKEVHASIYDGLFLSQANYTRFLHNDLNDLNRQLAKHTQERALITEGIFSMSGQLAPLASLTSFSPLVVDEAHSFGVLGDGGRGSVALHGLSQMEVPLRIVSLGKAFAAQGAIVAGRADWIEALLQAGRSIIYSTAMSPALTYGLLKTLDCVVQAEEERSTLHELVALFRRLVAQSPLDWADSISPIQRLRLGCPHLALHYAQELKKQDISCSAIRKPSVSTKESGLRVVLNAHHTPEQLDHLFNQIHILYEHQSL